MSDRYTRKDAEAAFDRLCDATGHRRATRFDDHGAWTLDYNAIYGGFVVEEILPDSSGITQPFGSARVPARQFCDRVRFALAVMHEAKAMK